jgi:hypothetical protein
MLQKTFVLLVLAGVPGALPAPAAALSTRFYVGATLGSINVSADEVDGRSLSAGALVGVTALPWLDIEAEFSKPSDPITRSYGGPDVLSLSFAGPTASHEELERAGIWLRYDKRRDIELTFSTVAIFRSPVRGRVVPGFIVGMTNHHVEDRTDYTPVRIGPDVDASNLYARPRAETGSPNIGALTFGVNLAVMITPRFGVVPDLRYDYGSIGDVTENSLRPSVRVLWRF